MTLSMADQIAVSEIIEPSKQQLWRGFGDDLELQYRCEDAAGRGKSIAANWLAGLLIFDFFLFEDVFVTGPLFPLFVIFRLGFCTPVCLVLMFMVRKEDRNCDLFSSAIPVMAVAPLAVLLLFSHGAYRTDYLNGGILMMVLGVMVNRSRLPWAAASVAAQCACLCLVTIQQASGGIDANGGVVSTIYCLSAGAIALLCSASLERSNRQAFLLRVRVSRLNRQLQEFALQDPLTGLGNRRCLDAATARIWSAEGGQLRQVSFILLDVDRFKLFNDSYGHSAGDVCLQSIARCVVRNTRQTTDLAIRFGGEEFIVFMPDTDLPTALMVAERIRLAIVREGIAHPALGAGAVVTASLGVASALTSAGTSEQLVARTDTALYEAKDKGRNRVCPTPIPALKFGLAS